MNIDIKLHKDDLPDDLKLGNVIAVDGEFMGLNVRRDPLCLIQISTGNSDAHIIQLDRSNYNAPNLVKVLSEENITKIVVVTGKGLHSNVEKDPYISKDFGILKYSVPEYIYKNQELMKLINEIKGASQKDGGDGAFYIYLKKKPTK